MDNTRSTTTVEQVQEWCTRAGTKVTIRPVIDLAEEMTTDAYTPDRADGRAGQAPVLECPFPGCHRPSRPGHKAKKRKKRTDPAGTGSSRSTGRTWTTARSGPKARRPRRTCSRPAGATTASRPSPDWTYDYDPATGFTWTSPLGYTYTDPGSNPDPRHPG